MAHQEGDQPPERRKGRAVLSAYDPLVKSAVAAINFERFNVPDTIAWGNQLQAHARRWLSAGGFGQRGSLNKRDARWLLKRELSKLEAGAK